MRLIRTLLCACVLATGCEHTGANRVPAAAAPQTVAQPPAAPAPPAASAKPKAEPVSTFGRYAGYSERLYQGYELSSQYVSVRDGTKLAIDLYRPKDAGGKVVTAPLPVLWMHTPYNRRHFRDGLTGERYPGAAVALVDYGYVVAVVDFRGLYASFGRNVAYNRGEWVDAARYDAYDVTEWLAAQPWSNGKIGMWGCSATGGSQLQAATTAPPHLEAIFPMSCEFDAYAFGVPGGMAPPRGLPTKVPPGDVPPEKRDALAIAVDGDAGGALLAQAVAGHADNIENAGYVPYRDSVAEGIGEAWWVKSSPHNQLDAIGNSGIAMYLAANWDEAATKHGAFFTFNNVKNPVKLLVGPGTHCAWFTVQKEHGFDLAIEELRFFDHWLKGVDNGVMAEPAVHYYTYNAAPGSEWRSSAQWPLPNERRTPYYLGAKTLGTAAPTDARGKDRKAVDYDVTPETMADKGLVYETEPLAADLLITGHPTADLWVASTAKDGDFIAVLQAVAPDGKVSSYNVSGKLRASHRKLADAPYEYLGLPWHPSNAADAQPLVPGKATLLQFELLPISMVVKAGHRIRLVLTFASGTATERRKPAPTVTILRDPEHPSSITLPVIPG